MANDGEEGLKNHPIAEIFPRMSDEDFIALMDDIEAYGVREPAWTWNKQVIDGRHRVLACEELGIKCPTREYEGTEAELVPFVLSLNLRRRHLDASQRAMIAASLGTIPIGETGDSPPIGGLTTEQSAELMNVGQRTVERAKKVIEHGVPELKAAVERGDVSVAAAAEVAELPKREQRRLVKEGAVKEAAAQKREKPKNDELDRVKAELENARDQLEEMGKAQQPLQDEVEFLRKIETEGDKLAAACAEVKRLQAVVRGQEERIRGLMNEVADYKQHSKKWQRMYEKAVKGAQK